MAATTPPSDHDYAIARFHSHMDAQKEIDKGKPFVIYFMNYSMEAVSAFLPLPRNIWPYDAMFYNINKYAQWYAGNKYLQLYYPFRGKAHICSKLFAIYHASYGYTGISRHNNSEIHKYICN